MQHRIEFLLNSLPVNTIEAKKDLAKETGVHIDTVNRWYGNPDVEISSNNLSKILAFFRKFNPKMQYEDLFNNEDTTTDVGLV